MFDVAKTRNILSGTNVAKEIREELAKNIIEMKKVIPNYEPHLTIVQVGNREDSNVYIKAKIKAGSDVGVKCTHLSLPRNITECELLLKVNQLNNDPTVHGIIVQLPFDTDNIIDSDKVTDAVYPEKDVDGLHTVNQGKLAIGNLSGFIPCTPNGVLELIKRTGVNIAGSKTVVVGRSKIVGSPAAELLKWNDSTVTVCHSKTKNLIEQISTADILVVAVGKAEFVRGNWIKPGAVVIDCGINTIPDATKKSGQRLVGDVAFEEACEIAGHITPVPGGVGPVTVAMLIKNTILSAQRLAQAVHKVQNTWNISVLPLNLRQPVPSDIEINRSQISKDIQFLANEIGLLNHEISLYGDKMAKIKLSALKRLQNSDNGKYVVIAGITPTSLGEGKTTATLGLVQSLVACKNKNAVACIRQPSQGPTFGIKGGAAGGGYAQVTPMEQFNLHLTGDIHAVTAANNLLAAQIDARIFHELTASDTFLYDKLVPQKKDGSRMFSPIQLRRLGRLGIDKTDPNSLLPDEIKQFVRLNINKDLVTWNRVMDTSDRFLRKITIGKSPTEKGHVRDACFDISVASELMAILALSKNMEDLKNRISRIVIGQDSTGKDVTADDLGVTGALSVLLKETIEPTLMQSLEGTPVLVHAGPFANIAHGCSSIIADLLALKLVGPTGYVITEAGFGSEIGMEKFFNIKCRYSGLQPNAVVLVTTVRALKLHGGASTTLTDQQYAQENIELVRKGCCNLQKHISNGTKYSIPVVVAINAMQSDTEAEWNIIKEESYKSGAYHVAVSHHWASGGAGAVDLAQAVIDACDSSRDFKFLYNDESSLVEKITTIAKEMYGAVGVDIPQDVLEELDKYEKKGYGHLPVCMAKTALSLTADPSIKGVPANYTLPVKKVYLSAGAGFLVVLTGEISKMPGLPVRPNIYDIDINTDTGEIEGLF